MTAARPPLRRYPALDGLRAVAVLLVIWHHAWGPRQALTPVEAVFRATAATGWVGVDLFFVLSGFLITRILLQQREAPNLLRAFWWRRLLRIAPPYYAYLAVVFVLLPALRIHRFEPGPWAKVAYAAFLSNVWIATHGLSVRQPLHLWSVAVEEQFYLVWPFVVRSARGVWLRRVVVALLVAAPAARALATLGGVGHVALYTLTPLRLDGLAWGALLALAEAAPGGLQRWRPTARIVAVAALVVALAWGVLRGGLLPDDPLLGLSAPLYALTGLGFAAGVTLVLTQPDDHPVNAWLAQRPLQALGRWSYTIYLLHPLVLMAVRFGGAWPAPAHQATWWYVPAMCGYAALVTAVTTVLAAASWRWLEAPLLKRKGRVAYHTRPGILPPSEAG